MKDNTAFKAIIAVVVLAALVGGTIILTREDDDNTDTASNTQTTSQTEATPAQQSATPTTQTEETTQTTSGSSEYADGTYSATGSYSSPGGRESIGVTVTLENDIITSVQLENEADSPTSRDFQESFIEGVVSLVTGVNIDDADVDQVSGSSLTSRGFNEALDSIKEEAES